MGKYNYMNLNQKMIRIRKKVPKLIRKRYSEDVTYDFVKLDDIYECLTPALNKYGVDFDILSERPTQMDEQGNSVFLKEMGALWRYEADLELCWTNADRPGDKVRSFLHVIGTNEAPDKAKGAAWTYNLKEKLALERKEKAEYAKKVGQLTMQVDWLKKKSEETLGPDYESKFSSKPFED